MFDCCTGDVLVLASGYGSYHAKLVSFTRWLSYSSQLGVCSLYWWRSNCSSAIMHSLHMQRLT